MLEMTEFPYLNVGSPTQAVAALIQLCRELPPEGEQFRFFRRRMKGLRLWDDERVQGTFDFLGLQRTGTVKPSPFVKSVRNHKKDEKARDALADRLWQVNPLLFKTMIDRLQEQVHSRDELIKHVHAHTYRGKAPLRPQLESWLHLALGLEILKMVGIAFDIGPNCERFIERARAFDVEEFLEDVREGQANSASTAPASEAPSTSAEDAADETSATGEPAATVAHAADSAPTPVAVAPSIAAAASSAPVARKSSGPEHLPIDVSRLSPPLGRDRPVSVGRFAGLAVFAEDVLAETTERIAAWWAEQSYQSVGATIEDFGLDASSWMEGADEALYRVAVAAALVFRAGGDRDTVKAAFEGLDRAGVLADLYYGTAPEELPENVDPKALMLASLVARRCAESPELANTLEQQASAAEAFAVLDQALGRGFLRIELFWMMRALSALGALRFDDLPGFAALPRRAVRDTLFRLGYIDSPYAHDAASLIPAARATRRAAGTAEPPDEVLMGFALAAGCAYDCERRRSCEYACRERADM